MPKDEKQFGKSMAAARKALSLSQSELGRRIGGVVQATISSWETGTTEPLPDQVFTIEAVLDLEGGLLSRYLGYVPVDEVTMQRSVTECIERDPNLEPWAKEVLLGTYRVVALSRQPDHDHDQDRTAFRHEALLYHGMAEFVSSATEYIEAGLRAGDQVVAMVDSEMMHALIPVLGQRDGLLYVDMEEGPLGREHEETKSVTRVIPHWQLFLDEAVQTGKTLRGLQATKWVANSPREILRGEWCRHEQLLDVAFEDGPGWQLLCAYDVATIDEIPTLRAACAAHPFVWERGSRQPNTEYAPVDVEDLLHEPLTAPPPHASKVVEVGSNWRCTLREVIQNATAANLDHHQATNYVMAVREVAESSLALAGDGGVVTLQTWIDDGAVVCEIRDPDEVKDPLLDRRRPADGETDRGLWGAGGACDLVQLRTTADGTVIRLYKWATEGPEAIANLA